MESQTYPVGLQHSLQFLKPNHDKKKRCAFLFYSLPGLNSTNDTETRDALLILAVTTSLKQHSQ